ncbi:hypothetical protein NOX90_06380 [Wolbachia endosymbiont of Anurida maritima]|uniref:hypothetical protein n=1 Tax=Wolbachia endosymbiont of Anurida maritima TaxID=2850562 RepID=UPI0035D0313A
MTGPQVKSSKPPKLPTQVTNKDEKIFEKEEHQVIYDYFVKTLEDKAKLKESKGITDYFILAYKKILLTNVNPEKIRPLSEENFCQFLLSVLKEIREKKLAGEEDSKVKQVVEGCLDDVRGTEAKDSLIKLVGLPLGIKIDPKNISGSFMDGVKEKIPFLGGDKKEEDEPPLTDEEMVTTFLRKVFLPILFSIASILIFGPTTLAIVAAVIGTIFAVKGGVEVLFSNNKPGTLYDPSSRDRDDTEKRAKLNGKILDGISKILGSEVNETEQSNQPAVTAEEQLTKKSKQPTVLEQVTLDPQTGQQR